MSTKTGFAPPLTIKKRHTYNPQIMKKKISMRVKRSLYDLKTLKINLPNRLPATRAGSTARRIYLAEVI
jgi:hypothetical protein